MKDFNSKFLYWIFAAVFFLETAKNFWFHVIFTPLWVILFFVFLRFSFFPALIFALFYGAFLDFMSSGIFGSHMVGFAMASVVFFVFRKIFPVKINAIIFIINIIISATFYLVSFYGWGFLYSLIYKNPYLNPVIILQENLLNLGVNFILIVLVYLFFIFRKPSNDSLDF